VRRWWAPALGAAVVAYYALVLTNGRLDLWTPALWPGWSGWRRMLGFTFNSMLLHLLHGEFDVDPEAIQWEALVRGGKTYAYFGILPALVRLPLLPFVDLRTTDVSALTCLLAVALAAAAKLAALAAIWRRAPDAGARRPAFVAVAVVTVLGGAQLQFLRVSVYQEAVLWAATCAAGFVALAVVCLVVRREFSGPALVALGALAGLAVLARVSTGLGLCVAFVALLARLAVRDARDGRLRAGRFAAPVVALALLVAAAGVVNYERLGNPLAFHAPALQTISHPPPFPQLDHYGVFNLVRAPYGVMYYFAPVWVLRDGHGGLLFHAFRERVFDLVELPPSSFLVSDPLLLLLAALGLGVVFGRRPPVGLDAWSARGIAAGLAVPPALMLVALAMTFRYRMEFYPLLELLALLALACSPVVARAGASARGRRALIVLAVVSVVVAHALVLLYKATTLGNLDPAVDLVEAYRTTIGRAMRRLW
jgi:hypothetical protein